MTLLLLRSIEKSYNENSVQRWSQTMIYHLASPYFLTSCCILIRIAPSLLSAPSVTLSCHLKALLGVRSRTEMFTIIAELDDGPHNSRPTPFSTDFIFSPGIGCQKKSWLELSGLLMKNDSQPYLVVLWRASPKFNVCNHHREAASAEKFPGQSQRSVGQIIS